MQEAYSPPAENATFSRDLGKFQTGRQRLARRREKIATFYNRLLERTLNALGAPDIAFDFLASAGAVLESYSLEAELSDLEWASKSIGPIGQRRRADRESREVLVQREADRRAKQRQRIVQWQARAENPLLFDYDGSYDHATGKRRAQYRFHVFELLREIAEDVNPYATSERIDSAVAYHAGSYRERFTGTANRTVKKRVQSPESDLHRAASLLKNAIEKARKSHGDEAAAEMVRTEFFSQFDGSEYANFVHFEKLNLLKTEDIGDDPGGHLSPRGAVEIPPPSPMESGPRGEEIRPTNQIHVGQKSEKPLRGKSMDDFTRETFPDKPIDYRLPKPSDDYLSLAEIEAFDPRGSGGNQRRFRCPACQSKQRQLTVNMATGAYQCKRGACGVKGKLREYFTQGPVIPGHRRPQLRTTMPPKPEPPPAPESETWRRWLAKAKPVFGTPGADYLTRRGIPAEIASAAGVHFGHWYQDGKPFVGVIFSIHNDKGELVAAQARAIEGEAKNTRGPKKDGVFLATPGALEAPEIAITEAPIDALALAAAGMPAIALCGVQWPDWLIDRLDGRRIYAAFDADEAGEKAAAELTDAFAGRADVSRLRPRGAKDWADVAQSYGVSAIEAEL